MKQLLLVYSSQTGRTEQLMRAAAEGAAEFADEVSCQLKRAPEAGIDDLLAADGLLIGSPENFGYLSGLVKDFLDRTYYPAEGKTIALPYAVLISAGNDGSGAVSALQRIASGYRWKLIAPALIIKGEPDAAGLAQARELGQTLAAGVAYGAF